MTRLWRPQIRRVVLVIVLLAGVDVLVRPALRRLEHARYEQPGPFRFENSDLFGLGPLVEYLREHPSGALPRTAFFGNSVVWGYGLRASQALPAQMEALDPTRRVFSVAINGFDTGNSYLIARAMAGTVDRLYVLLQGFSADAILPQLIPVGPEDVREFRLAAPSRLERSLQKSLAWWDLYRYSYRLQMAMFGTSTRQYVYLNKGDLARGLIARVAAAEPQPRAAGVVTVSAPRSDAVSPEEERRLQTDNALMWRFGTLARAHGMRAVFLYMPGYSRTIAAQDIPAFNALFAPHGEVVIVDIPRALERDGLHLTAAGARAVAAALLRHERAREGEGR